MKVDSDAVGAVARRRAGSLTAIVQAEIERMIISGGLETGQRLNEQQLAVQLGVSRGPVREALRALERAGLVDLDRERPARVRLHGGPVAGPVA